MKKIFFLIFFLVSFIELSAVEIDDEVFSADFLHRKSYFKFTPSFISHKNDFSINSGYSLLLDFDFFFPHNIFKTFLNTGVVFAPSGYSYGGGFELKILDFLIRLGYLGSLSFSVSIIESEVIIKNRNQYVNLGYLLFSQRFDYWEIKNNLGYGVNWIADIYDESKNDYTSKIEEQIFNTVDINFFIYQNFSFTTGMFNKLSYKWVLKPQVDVVDYSLSLKNNFYFDNFMRISIVPKYSVAYSSDEDKVFNRANFFKISPYPVKFIRTPSFKNTKANGLMIFSLDLAYRFFPFSYIPGNNIFKGVFSQILIYSGWIFDEGEITDIGIVDKSRAMVSFVLSIGTRAPYDDGEIVFGIGWNNLENLILMFYF